MRNQWKESERRRRRGVVVVSIFLPLTHLAAIATVLFCHRSEPNETSSERGLSVCLSHEDRMHAHVCYRGRSSCMPLHFRPHFKMATFLPKQSADTPRVAIAGGQKGSRETRVAIARRDSAAKKNIFHLPQEEAVAILCGEGDGLDSLRTVNSTPPWHNFFKRPGISAKKGFNFS